MTTATFWTLESTSSYGHELVLARRFTDTEKARYAEWFADYGMVAVGNRIKLPYVTWQDNPNREADGQFVGCDNQAWTLTAEEMQHYTTLNAERKVAHEAKDATAKAAADAKRATIFADAKQSNAPKELDSWTSHDCLDHLTDCSFDLIVLLAMPDGTTKQEHTHCF